MDPAAFLPKEQAALERGEEMRGQFWMADAPESRASGVLRWSRLKGAELWLIAPGADWPGVWSHAQGGTEHPIRLHGLLVGQGVRVTIPDGIVTASTFGTGAPQLKCVCSRLVLFAHLRQNDTWKRMTFRSANLHEWFPITGFEQPEMVVDRRFQVRSYALRWKVPRGTRVPLKDAEIRFSPRMMASPVRDRPDRSISTAMDIHVVAKERATIDELHQRFATPFVDLLVIAGGIPDALTYEGVIRGKQSRAVVLRRGNEPTWREWRPDRPLLFYAADLPDLRMALRKWFDLHARLSPAFEVLARSINEDRRYSPERLLNVASSLEAYHRVLHEGHWWRRWRNRHPASKRKRSPTLLERVTHLQQLSGLPESVTGLGEASRELFVSSRNHFAHLDEPRYGYIIDDVYDNTVPSIRRGVALIQACIMRRLGLTPGQARACLAEHYRGWSIT